MGTATRKSEARLSFPAARFAAMLCHVARSQRLRAYRHTDTYMPHARVYVYRALALDNVCEGHVALLFIFYFVAYASSVSTFYTLQGFDRRKILLGRVEVFLHG